MTNGPPDKFAMRRFDVCALLLVSYVCCARVPGGWRRSRAFLPPLHNERVHRRARQLTPAPLPLPVTPLLRHLRVVSSQTAHWPRAGGKPDSELGLALKLTRPSAADTAKSYHNDYDALLETLLDEVLFIHSGHKSTERSSACAEVVDNEALLLRSIARSTKSLVGLRADMARTPISYCAPATGTSDKSAASMATATVAATAPLSALAASAQSSPAERLALVRLLFDARTTPRNTSECAIDAKCATIYSRLISLRWKPAKVDRGDAAPSSGEQSGATDEVLVPSGCTCVINALAAGLSDLPIIVF